MFNIQCNVGSHCLTLVPESRIQKLECLSQRVKEGNVENCVENRKHQNLSIQTWMGESLLTNLIACVCKREKLSHAISLPNCKKIFESAARSTRKSLHAKKNHQISRIVA